MENNELCFSKKSWHFRLIRKYGTRTMQYALAEPISEGITKCTYFRWLIHTLVMLSIAVIFSMFIIVVGGGFLVVFPIYELVALIVWDTTFEPLKGVGITLLCLYAGFMFISGVTSTIKGNMHVWPKWLPVGKWFREKFPERLMEEKVKPPKEPNVFIEWVKSRHDKFCAPVKFK